MSSPISSLGSLPAVEPLEVGGTNDQGEFQNLLHSAIAEVERAHASADSAIQSFLSGEEGELHTTILATQKAELEFDVFMQIRNKVISAYQEIMRMQL